MREAHGKGDETGGEGNWCLCPYDQECLGMFVPCIHLKDGVLRLWVYSVGKKDMAEKYKLRAEIPSGTLVAFTTA